MGTLVRTPCQNKKSREPSSQDFWQGHKWLTRRTAPPMRFSDEKHARLCGSPYKNKRPPNGGLLFWQGHKGSNSGHAVLETAKKVRKIA